MLICSHPTGKRPVFVARTVVRAGLLAEECEPLAAMVVASAFTILVPADLHRCFRRLSVTGSFFVGLKGVSFYESGPAKLVRAIARLVSSLLCAHV